MDKKQTQKDAGRKKLLSLTHLTKYFPVKKTSIFQKEQLYVRANEDITFDIYEGETFGLVGESGCGKSTLGRVLLQLYPQTGGSTVYYGRTLAEVAPHYVKDTLVHAEKYIHRYQLAREKAAAAKAACEAKGDAATYHDHRTRIFAENEQQTALDQVAKILGGFMAVEHVREHAALLLDQYEIDVRLVRLTKKSDRLQSKLDLYAAREDAQTQLSKKMAALQSELTALQAEKKELQAKRDALTAELEAEKAKYKSDPAFQEYEQLLDEGVDLARLSYHEMRYLRRDLQIIFQDPYSSLDPRMTVGQIIEEGLLTHGFFKRGSPKMQDYILKEMEDCGLQSYMLHRYPHQFSGGQRQRICIARALAVKPKFVVCDECVSALDVSIQSQIINLLEELKEKENLTYLFISHDLSVIRYISDRIGVMYLGNLVELSDTKRIFEDPRHPYTVALLSSVPTTDEDDAQKERIILEGSIPSPVTPPSGCKFHTRCFMACDKCREAPPPMVEVEPGHYVACHFPERKLGKDGEYLFQAETGKKVERT
jgi:peptide/nickel transport system ATP-binding protein